MILQPTDPNTRWCALVLVTHFQSQGASISSSNRKLSRFCDFWQTKKGWPGTSQRFEVAPHNPCSNRNFDWPTIIKTYAREVSAYTRQVLKHHKAKGFFVLNTSQSHFNLSKNSFYMLINSLLAFVNELELNSSLSTFLHLNHAYSHFRHRSHCSHWSSCR